MYSTPSNVYFQVQPYFNHRDLARPEIGETEHVKVDRSDTVEMLETGMYKNCDPPFRLHPLPSFTLRCP